MVNHVVLFDILSVFKEVVFDTRRRLIILCRTRNNPNFYLCKVEDLMVFYTKIDNIYMIHD